MTKIEPPTKAEIASAKRIIRKAGQISTAAGNKVAGRRKASRTARASRRRNR